jgi:hypothetical protein
MLLPLTSKLPPNCGLVSVTISNAESDTFTVFADTSNVANVISSEPSKNFNMGADALEVSNQNVPDTALAGLELPELVVFIDSKTSFKSLLNDGKDWFAIVKSVDCAMIIYTPFKILLQ